MLKLWFNGFYNAARKADAELRRLVGLPREPTTMTWDGTMLRDHLTPDDWKSMYRAIAEQVEQKNDRGVAITCASMVEDRLKWVLERNVMEGVPASSRKFVLGGSGPLQSYAAKVEVGCCFGIVPLSLREELRLIGKIRNKFAHSFRQVRFTDPEITVLCNKLRLLDPSHAKDRPSLKDDVKEHMQVYFMSCFVCMTTLFAIGQIPGHWAPPPQQADGPR